MGLFHFHHVLVYMGDLHLVHPALNLSILDAGILIMVQQVSLMMFSLNMVDFPMSFLSLSTCFVGQVEGTILRCSYSLIFWGDPSFILKYNWREFSVNNVTEGSDRIIVLAASITQHNSVL